MPMHVFAGGMSWAEFAVFCVFTTVIGAFYHWLTMRTNSIYPACIAHSLNNNLASMLFLTMIFSEQGMGVFAGDVGAVTLTSSMTPVVAAVFILIDLLIRKKLKNKQTA